MVRRKLGQNYLQYGCVPGPMRWTCPRETLLLRLRIFSDRCPINKVWLPDSKDKMEVC